MLYLSQLFLNKDITKLRSCWIYTFMKARMIDIFRIIRLHSCILFTLRPSSLVYILLPWTYFLASNFEGPHHNWSYILVRCHVKKYFWSVIHSQPVNFEFGFMYSMIVFLLQTKKVYFLFCILSPSNPLFTIAYYLISHLILWLQCINVFDIRRQSWSNTKAIHTINTGKIHFQSSYKNISVATFIWHQCCIHSVFIYFSMLYFKFSI